MGHDLSGPGANQGRVPDFDFDRDYDLTDRPPLPGGDACRSVLFQTSSRLLQFLPNRRAYDDLLQALNLLGVLAVHLMGPAIAG